MGKSRGDISATTLIGVILLIIGFGIVFMFIARLYNSENVDREACQESVTLRGIASGLTPYGTGENFVTLRCKTQKLCLTSAFFGGDCSQNFGNERVLNKKVKNENGISKVISDEVLACWDMMGQGRVSLFSPGWTANLALRSTKTTDEKLGTVYSSCVVCSRIAFDVASLGKQKINLSKVDVYDYMLRYKVPGEELSYAQYIAAASPAGVSLTDKDKIENISNNIEKQLATASGVKLEELKSAGVPLKSGELAVVFMNIQVPTGADVLKNILLASIGGGYVGGKAANFVSGGKATTALVSSIVANPLAAIAVIVGTVAIVGGAATYNYYSNYQTAAGHCGDVKFEGKDSYGCSAVRVITYDADTLKLYCDTIESIS